ncbi:MAG: hypothetical protein JMJ93_03785 [Synergistaceae bacterium]|nr:hypothetical protein [Synergistaceae bacterium]
MKTLPTPFQFKSCELVPLSTGLRSQSLEELASHLQAAPKGSLHYHFWGRLLRPQIGESEFGNDFASWAESELHDRTLAERLSAINPSDHADLESLREEVLGIIEERLDEEERLHWTRAERPFFFSRAQMLVFDSGLWAATPKEMGKRCREIERSSIFYHFIDARRRTEHHDDDFSCWLEAFEETEETRRKLRYLDPYLLSLEELREILLEHFALFEGRDSR